MKHDDIITFAAAHHAVLVGLVYHSIIPLITHENVPMWSSPNIERDRVYEYCQIYCNYDMCEHSFFF